MDIRVILLQESQSRLAAVPATIFPHLSCVTQVKTLTNTGVAKVFSKVVDENTQAVWLMGIDA